MGELKCMGVIYKVYLDSIFEQYETIFEHSEGFASQSSDYTTRTSSFYRQD